MQGAAILATAGAAAREVARVIGFTLQIIGATTVVAVCSLPWLLDRDAGGPAGRFQSVAERLCGPALQERNGRPIPVALDGHYECLVDRLLRSEAGR